MAQSPGNVFNFTEMGMGGINSSRIFRPPARGQGRKKHIDGMRSPLKTGLFRNGTRVLA